MKLNDLIKFKALALEETIYPSLQDHMLASVPKDQIKDQTRNVCALINVKLFNDLDHVCTFLGMSKRLFIEAAIAHAVDLANKEIEPLEEAIVDRYNQTQEEAA